MCTSPMPVAEVPTALVTLGAVIKLTSALLSGQSEVGDIRLPAIAGRSSNWAPQPVFFCAAKQRAATVESTLSAVQISVALVLPVGSDASAIQTTKALPISGRIRPSVSRLS